MVGACVPTSVFLSIIETTPKLPLVCERIVFGYTRNKPISLDVSLTCRVNNQFTRGSRQDDECDQKPKGLTAKNEIIELSADDVNYVSGGWCYKMD